MPRLEGVISEQSWAKLKNKYYHDNVPMPLVKTKTLTTSEKARLLSVRRKLKTRLYRGGRKTREK